MTSYIPRSDGTEFQTTWPYYELTPTGRVPSTKKYFQHGTKEESLAKAKHHEEFMQTRHEVKKSEITDNGESITLKMLLGKRYAP